MSKVPYLSEKSQIKNRPTKVRLLVYLFSLSFVNLFTKVEKSRITHHLIEQSQIDIVSINDLDTSEPSRNLELKWTEHHRWLQLKTVLPRGVQISKYAIDVSENFKMKVQDTEGYCYYAEFDLYLPVCQWLSAPLSKSVIKVSS